MGSMSIWHWLIVLLVVVLVFGTQKLRGMGADLGAAARDFKRAARDDSDTANPDAPKTPAEPPKAPGRD